MAELKQVVQRFKGQTTDFTDETSPNDFFTDALNIRFNSDKKVVSGGFSFEKGNTRALTLGRLSVRRDLSNRYYVTGGSVDTQFELLIDGEKSEVNKLFINTNGSFKTSGKQLILELLPYDKGLIIFSTDNNGFDCIWEYNIINNTLQPMYVRDMEFSTHNPIQALFNYENESINKIYWVDGKSQMRFLNLRTSTSNGDYENLIDVPLASISHVGTFNISQPQVEVLATGGNHTAGAIQYAYSLYKLNGNQTKLSPLSPIISLGNGSVGGGGVNELVTDLPKITIKGIDNTYSNIRLYAIKYTSYNTLPEVYMVLDRKLTTSIDFEYFDAGINKIQDMSIEQLLFIGSDPIYPKHIEARDNHLFMANYKETDYVLKGLDTRAFGFLSSTSSNATLANKFTITEDSEGNPNGYAVASDAEQFLVSRTSFVNLPDPTKGFNPVNITKALYNTNGLGVEGKYISLDFEREFNPDFDVKTLKNVLKDDEVYRFAIKFYNGYGQYTDPSWIADYYTKTTLAGDLEQSNLTGHYLSVRVRINPSLNNYLNDKNNFLDINGKFDPKLKPVGYKLLRGIRGQEDRLVIAQGMVNTMMSMNPYANGYEVTDPTRIDELVDQGFKMPWFLRTSTSNMAPMHKYQHKDLITQRDSDYFDPSFGGRKTEVFRSVSTDNKRVSHWQFNTLMQMYSPDILFNIINTVNTNTVRFKGLLYEEESSSWLVETKVDNLNQELAAKTLYRLNPNALEVVGQTPPKDVSIITGNPEGIFDYGMVAPTGGDSFNEVQFYRDFSSFRFRSQPTPLDNRVIKLLKSPVMVEKGQGNTSYNGLPKYTFTNKMNAFRTDTPRSSSGTSDPKGKAAILNFNSHNARNITFVEADETPLENIYSRFGYPVGDDIKGTIPLVEFIRDISYYYMDSMYNGNGYEGKLLTEYMEVGDYYPLLNSNSNIIYLSGKITQPGDMFSGTFIFEKLSVSEGAKKTDSFFATEIMKIRCESEVDLSLRNDLSVYSWDNFFMPKYDDFHRYNRVYSQQNVLFKNVQNAYNFKQVNEYTNRIIASRKKNSGELIDSWTDTMVNNILDVDGKYGPINDIKSIGNGLIALQSKAVSMISVNPRVQVQAEDGNSIELGTGTVLNDYRYITTDYGSTHKWANTTTPNGLYFYDSLNNSINLIGGEGVLNLTKSKGVSTYFKELIPNSINLDGSIIEGNAITMGSNLSHGDVYLVHNNKVCYVFNEVLEYFAGRLPYTSYKIENFGERTYSVNPNSKDQLFLHDEGEYNTYYGIKQDSSITFLSNPEPLKDCVFNNLSFKSESYKDGILVNMNWDNVEVYNEYQRSKVTELIERVNTRKMNRITNITLPREANSRNRIRNNWATIKLTSKNKDTKSFLNNSFVIGYTAVDRIIN